jgi:MauM/NapG family ferredoxin protein
MNSLRHWLKNFVTPPLGTELNLKRRSLLTAGVAGLGAGLLCKAQPAMTKRDLNPAFLRPPGALAEDEFLSKCIRCGECMKVCPTNAIQPAMLETGMQGMWSPLLKMRLGYCEYKCNMCTQVCPTGAIKALTLEKKQKTKIGLSMVDKSRCLAYAYGKECQVCHDHCPLSDKAIVQVEATVSVGSKTLTIKQPQVDAKLCIGCGICENKCPVKGQAAIRVVSV